MYGKLYELLRLSYEVLEPIVQKVFFLFVLVLY